MTESISRSIARALATGVLWTACVMLSVSFTRESGGLAMVWPAGAVLTAVLLIEHPRRRCMPLLAVVASSAAMSLLFPYGPMVSGLLAIARIGESLLAA